MAASASSNLTPPSISPAPSTVPSLQSQPEAVNTPSVTHPAPAPTPPVAPANANANANAHPNGDATLKVKKPTMTSRISNMFNKRDEGREAAKAADRNTDTKAPNGAAARPPPSRQPSVSASKSKDGNTTPYRRFWTNEDGSHEHHLKVAKRQEKLSDMFQNLMLGKKKDSHNEDQPLSLMANWVDVMRNEKEKLAEQKNSASNHTSQTLVQKYGKCQEVVGRGAFGIVRVAHKTDAKDPKREHLYAVKEFKQRPGESAKKYQKRLTAEFCISSSMQHPNVINTLDLLQDDKGTYCEVMEYCSGGDLYTLVLAAGQLEVVEADCFFKQLMRGVEYMHEMGVAHRDLKLLMTSPQW